MDYRDSADEAVFRQEVREFIRTQLPDELKPGYTPPAGTRQDTTDIFNRGASWRVWTKRMAEKGWIAPAWPKEYGGGGMSVMQQFIFNEEMSEARAPDPAALPPALPAQPSWRWAPMSRRTSTCRRSSRAK